MDSFFFQAFIYLAAAVLSVPIAHRLGLGSVLGYLIAGMIIGPSVLSLVGGDGHDVMHVAEFGVVMMLFIIGLELEPRLLWRMRASIAGLGGLQVLVTMLVVAAGCILLGLDWKPALAIGMTLAMSSTAIVLQTMNEKGLMKTAAGQSSFSVLLFQDIAVIPILAVFPLLATGEPAGAGHSSLIAHWPAWLQTLTVIGAVSVIVLGGRFLVQPAFRFIAKTRLQELFTASALFLVIAIAMLMSLVGLSPALGTFLAGVVLATSEYRHELISDLEPFKGLLLGLFFISVGASIDFELIASSPGLIFGLVILLMVVKGLILFALGRLFGMTTSQNLVFAVGLSQVGEFAFVLISFAMQSSIFTSDLAGTLIAIVAISMALTPLAILLNEKVILPRFGTTETPSREADMVHGETPVIIAGYDQFGNTVGRLLKANGIDLTVLDDDADRVDLIRRLGLQVFYGDATRLELLHAAGAHHASVIIIAFDDADKNQSLVHTVQQHFPHLKILVRAIDRPDAYHFINAGIDGVYRDTLDTSLRMGVDALRLLGFRAHKAHRAAQTFLRHDEIYLRELAAGSKDQVGYIRAAREKIAALERIIQADGQIETTDAGWDPDSLRDEVTRGDFRIHR
ncbi:MAG: cation:proton antiporter [Bacteroidetes bacterium]|nr:cation:proton antiporter [Bacteroidota bacterium]